MDHSIRLDALTEQDCETAREWWGGKLHGAWFFWFTAEGFVERKAVRSGAGGLSGTTHYCIGHL